MNQIHQDTRARMVNPDSETEHEADTRQSRASTVGLISWTLSGLAAGFASALLLFRRRPHAHPAQRSSLPHTSTTTRHKDQDLSRPDPLAADAPTDSEIDEYFVAAERDIRLSFIGIIGSGAVLAAAIWLVATSTANDFSAVAIADRASNLRAAFDLDGVSTTVLVAVLGLVALVASLNVAIAAVSRGAEGRSSQDRVRTSIWLRAVGSTAYLLGTLAVGIAALQVAAWPSGQVVATSLIAAVALATAILAATTTLGIRSREAEARTRALNDRQRKNIKARLQHLNLESAVDQRAPVSARHKLASRLRKIIPPSFTLAIFGAAAVTVTAFTFGHPTPWRFAFGILLVLVYFTAIAAYVHYTTFARWTSGTARRAIPQLWRVRVIRGLLIAMGIALISLAIVSPPDRIPGLASACVLLSPVPAWIVLGRTCPSGLSSPDRSARKLSHWFSAGTWELIAESLRSKLKQLEPGGEETANPNRRSEDRS